MAGRLLSVAEMLAPALAVLKPVAPTRLALRDAPGALPVTAILAPHALPAGNIALRGGHAVAALDLVGASPHSPVLLPAMPPRVAAGDTLPGGADSVLPPEGLVDEGAFIEVSRALAPGEGVRFGGQDLAAGALLAPAGVPLTARHLLVLALAGIETVDTRRPLVRLPGDAQPEAAWLATACRALGCGISAPGEQVDLALGWSDAQGPALALNPGDSACLHLAEATPPTILLPRRFDGMIAAFVALALPLLERLGDRRVATGSRPLTRKIASTAGIAEIVLLRSAPEGYRPLAIGDITLAALAEADRIALVPPESEGAAAGSMLAAWPLELSIE